MDEIDRKIEELGQRIERRFEEISRDIEAKLSNPGQPKSTSPVQPRRDGSAFLGVILAGLGLVLLGNSMNWFDLDLPLLPMVLILFGGYLIFVDRH